jgi:ABC-type branched-subunit amino acid transport system substrate-binding protein
LSSDTGLSTLRGAEIAIEELNAAGGFARRITPA